MKSRLIVWFAILAFGALGFGPALAGNPTIVIKTSMGTIEAVLHQDKAPISVQNILKYVDAKFYDGTVFHRVIPGFMIQGGGHEQGSLQKKEMRSPVKNESDNGLQNKRGTLALARTQIPDSARAQFFINLKDNGFLNRGAQRVGYAVFGKVTKGMDVVDRIAKVKTGSRGPGALAKDVPLTDIVIESVRVKQ